MPLENPKLADRAALMTRAAKRDVDKGELRRSWQRQAAELGFSAEAVRAKARGAERERPLPDLFTDRGQPAVEAATWAVEHVSERQPVFGHGDLLAAALAREPGAVTAEAAERAIAGLEREGGLHAAKGLESGKHWTTDAAMARESEAIALMRAGQGAGKTIMRGWIAETKLHGGPSQRGAEGSGEDDPNVEGPGVGRAGIRRNGQDVALCDGVAVAEEPPGGYWHLAYQKSPEGRQQPSTYGVAWSFPSREEAKAAAIEACEKQGSYPCMEAYHQWGRNECFAIVRLYWPESGRTRYQSYDAQRDTNLRRFVTEAEARQYATDHARRRSSQRERATVDMVACSGAPKKIARE